MTIQTIKKQVRLATIKILDRYAIPMADAIASEIADAVYDVVVSRKRVKLTTCPSEWMKSLYRICGISEITATPAMRHVLSECGQALINSGAELNDLTDFHSWWKSDEWREQNIPYPSAKQIRDSWGKFQNSISENNGSIVIEVQ